MPIVRSSLAATAILLSLTATSLAADVVATDPSPGVVLSEPSYIWSGPYVGVFAGASGSEVDQSVGPSFDGDGYIGGVFAGYNLQTDQLVYGLEGDIGYSGLDAGGFDAATGAPVTADSSAFGSLRARVGVAFDPFLFFATGGVAVANKELSANGAEDDNVHFGYTLGAGVETQVTDDISARLEYRYSDFETKDYELGGVTTSTGFDENSVRAGLALKF